MFDPTIFDNLKVVIEGAIYDRDLDGELAVIDRKDMIDLASLARSYVITIKNRDIKQDITATITLVMDLTNLSAELLNTKGHFPGCQVNVVFNMKMKEHETTCEQIQQTMYDIWGKGRKVTQEVTFIFQQETQREYLNTIKLEFERLIGEDQMDDLLGMIPYILSTTKELSNIISE
ncbi:hypothetical protein [Bacillus sp. PS06]|uniref:hypothetical protein n=1 Tax=Bacillus sp. PS06 TaxID=2764176 RepID=UPI00177B512F|nr:hypothetical protein [Bacillus sp. PS06]MBD8068094.1 hypothetical protein [Bacillus sp. PS06]